jgi:hypothetical protein
MPHREIRTLLRLLDEAYERKAWHGPNLRGSLRGLTARQAAWRPGRGRHNIWEIALHCAYWKYAVRRRLTGEKRGSFAVAGSNWFARPAGHTEKAWRGELKLLEQTHRALRRAVAAFEPARLHRRPTGSRSTPFGQILGVAFHDVYHAGQIQLLKRLYRH